MGAEIASWSEYGKAGRREWVVQKKRKENRANPAVGFTLLQKRYGWLWKVLAGLEGDGVPAFDFDLFAGLGISAHTGFPINLFESTKSDQSNPAVLFLEPFLDTGEQ